MLRVSIVELEKQVAGQRELPAGALWDCGRRDFPGQALLGPGLYFGILAFNLIITLWIGETILFLAGVFIYLPFLTWLGLKVWR